MKRAGWLACSLCFTLIACDGIGSGDTTNPVASETRDSSGTLIHTAAPLAAGLSQLNIFQPKLGSKVKGVVTFNFDTTASPQGMLLLFSREPEKLVNGRLPSGLAANGCIGGIVSMAGMYWGSVAVLDSFPHREGFHACTGSEYEPIDVARPISLDALTPGQTVWWVVVGYDKDLYPVATSPVFSFVWSGK